MANHTQTGSISFEATNAVHLSAEGRYDSLSDNLRDNYYTKSEFTVAPDKILSTVKEHAEQSARPNLSPYFSHPLTDVYDADENPDGYWKENRTDFWTNLTDGWGHVERVNSGSSEAWCNFYVSPVPNGLKPDTEYTFLVEWRNAVISGTGPQIAPTTVFASMPDCFVGAAYSPRITDGSEGSAAIAVTTIADLSQAVVFSRGYVAMPAGTSMSMDVRVSLYEGTYEGPYKPYVDQSLITRVSTAETAIEQNAEAITLRAQEIERGMTFVPTKHDRGDAWFWYSLPATAWTFLDDGWAHYEYTNAGTSEVSTYIAPKSWGQVIPGEEYTFLIEIKNYSGFSGTGQFMYMQEMAGAQFWGTTVVKANGNVKSTRISYDDIVDGAFTKRFVKLADVDHIGDGTTYDNMCFRYRMYIKPNTTLSIDVRISVYPGDYAGPYNEYLTAASSAQLKVANDAITSKVSTTDYNGQTIASLINQSADTVKIQAQHVEIDGTTTFTSGTTLADYVEGKAQDAADSVVVGGRNLLRRTATPLDWAINVTTYSTHHLYSTGSTDTAYDGPTLEELGFGVGDEVTFTFDWATSQNGSTAIRYGSFRIEYYGVTSSGTNGYITRMGDVVTMSASNASGRFSRTAALTAATIKTQRMVVRVDNSALVFSVSNAKLEKGNKATDWSPAPEDQTDYVDSISIGGRNLLLDSANLDGPCWRVSNATITGNQADPDGGTAAVLLHPSSTGWYFGSSNKNAAAKVVGQQYTFSVWLKAASATSADVCMRYLNGDDPYSSTATRKTVSLTTSWQRFYITGELVTAQSSGGDNVWVGQKSTVDVYVYHPKLEKGNRPTDWSPAPEDVTSRTQRIYYRTSSSTAPTSQYMPTAWVTETGDKWAANSTTVANWTAKATKLTNGSGTKYPYLFTCEQRQMGDGTLAYTTVLLDETTTVIDGGSIITNSIDANKLTVYDATIGKIKADAIDVSAIKIGELDGASTVVSNAANGKSAYDRHTAYRGTCSTAAGTAAKVVACTGFALATGATVEVYCSTANTANVPTLNVNSTGAKAVWINGAVASASNPCKWLAGDTVTFTYDGTRFRASLPVEGYVTEGTGGGLMVHRKSDATTGVKITDSVEILQNGTSVAEYGATARVGKSDSGHIEIASDSLTVYAKDYNSNLVKAATIKTVLMQSGLWNSLYFVDDNDNHDFALVYGTKYQTKTVAGVYAESIEEALVSIDAFNPHGTSMASIGLTATVQDSEVTITADSISLNGSLTLSTPLADANLPTKGSAGTAGTSSATSGATLAVPYVTTDAYGRVTAKGTHTHTINNLPSTALPTVPVDKGGTGQTGVTTVTAVASFIAAASGVTVSSVRVTVWGKLVHAYVVAKPSAAQSAAWVVGTVVAAYRPNAVVTGKPYYTGVDSARIQTNGTMQITACGAVEVGVSFTYLLA